MSSQGTQEKPSRSKKRAHAPDHLVVPGKLPSEVLRVFQQALQSEPIERGFAWILKETSDERPPTELAEAFLSRYEEQIMRLRGSVIDSQLPAFRAALIAKCLAVLPFFRVRFADRGYNALFLKTWLQKELLATLMGIAQRDVEAKIRHSGKTPPHYLEELLGKLMPHTCLAQLR